MTAHKWALKPDCPACGAGWINGISRDPKFCLGHGWTCNDSAPHLHWKCWRCACKFKTATRVQMKRDGGEVSIAKEDDNGR